jgi:hypothetical protein
VLHAALLVSAVAIVPRSVVSAAVITPPWLTG